MFSLIFDAGISTSSWNAVDAFLMRANMSAMGSVIDIYLFTSPRRLRDAGDLPVMGHVTETKAAEAELAEDRPRPTTAHATRVLAHLELLFALGLVD
jgi:hypothetical protein